MFLLTTQKKTQKVLSEGGRHHDKDESPIQSNTGNLIYRYDKPLCASAEDRCKIPGFTSTAKVQTIVYNRRFCHREQLL